MHVEFEPSSGSRTVVTMLGWAPYGGSRIELDERGKISDMAVQEQVVRLGVCLFVCAMA